MLHRLSIAGGRPEIFPEDSLALLHKFGRGRPRLMNTLADNALFEAYLQKSTCVASNHVEQAAGDLGIGLDPGSTYQSMPAQRLPSDELPDVGAASEPAALPPADLPSADPVMDAAPPMDPGASFSSEPAPAPVRAGHDGDRTRGDAGRTRRRRRPAATPSPSRHRARAASSTSRHCSRKTRRPRT